MDGVTCKALLLTKLCLLLIIATLLPTGTLVQATSSHVNIMASVVSKPKSVHFAPRFVPPRHRMARASHDLPNVVLYTHADFLAMEEVSGDAHSLEDDKSTVETVDDHLARCRHIDARIAYNQRVTFMAACMRGDIDTVKLMLGRLDLSGMAARQQRQHKQQQHKHQRAHQHLQCTTTLKPILQSALHTITAIHTRRDYTSREWIETWRERPRPQGGFPAVLAAFNAEREMLRRFDQIVAVLREVLAESSEVTGHGHVDDGDATTWWWYASPDAPAMPSSYHWYMRKEARERRARLRPYALSLTQG